MSQNECPVNTKSKEKDNEKEKEKEYESECPVKHNDIPNIIGDLPTGQERQPNQKVDLSVRRAVSNIDKVRYCMSLIIQINLFELILSNN